jgi:MerR family transcriptional regulator, mercuric resistance operon regulatory protein
MRAITASRASEYTIGKLSALTAVNIETIRYYERTKVLPAPPRTASGRRLYRWDDVRTLAFLRRARELGFSLDDVRTLLRLGGPQQASCREVRRIAAHHLDEIRAKIDDLRKLERLLAKTTAQCTGTTAPDCPVLDILDVRRCRQQGGRAAPRARQKGR